MKLLYSVFFAAGAAAVIYSRMGKRVGYDNQANVWTIVGVSFVILTIVFYTVLSFFVPEN